MLLRGSILCRRRALAALCGARDAPSRKARSRCRRPASRTASGWREKMPATTRPIRIASARTFRRRSSWANPPEGTKSYALLMFDPEGRPPGGVSHWVAYGIPASVTGFAEGEVSKPSATNMSAAKAR